MARDPGGILGGGPVELGSYGAAEGADGGCYLGVEGGEADVWGLARWLVLVGFRVGIRYVVLVAGWWWVRGGGKRGLPVIVVVVRCRCVVVIVLVVALVREYDAVLVQPGGEVGG